MMRIYSMRDRGSTMLGADGGKREHHKLHVSLHFARLGTVRSFFTLASIDSVGSIPGDWYSN